MTQEQRLDYLLRELYLESSHKDLPEMHSPEEKRDMLRALFNIRPPLPADDAFLAVQDAYLQEEIAAKGITDAAALPTISEDLPIALWQGDITTLKADAIVNAANSALLGCFIPCHACIDNAIHSYSGLQLRLACDMLIKEQGHEEPTGQAKITEAYNLPSRYILHTVGPIIEGNLTQGDCELLASCYRSCLEIALERGLSSIAFCCVSTGEFHFPQERAAEIAIDTIKNFLRTNAARMKVICNVFKRSDYEIYRRLLAR